MNQQEDELCQLAKILFPGDDEESVLHRNESFESEQLSYLSRLGSQGLDSLNGEIARLGEEIAIVEHQTRDMASQNYQIFVQSAQTTNKIQESLSTGNAIVEGLESITFSSSKKKLHEFAEEACLEFKQQEKSIKQISSNQDLLLKVLDMPWLVRRCLAEERLSHAIKILQAVQDMSKSLSEPPVLLKETCNEVMELKTEVQNALLAKLSSGSIGLSECLQTVSLLRSFFPDDKSLRFRFLQSRMKDVPFEEARTWIFDTLTQHRAAFGGDSSHYLSTWVALQIQKIIADIQKHVEAGESMDSLLTQSTYFGESFARVGADMRGLIIPIFSDQMVKRFQHQLFQAELKFTRNIHSCNLSSIAQFASPDSANLDLPPPEDLSPPMQLLSHVPLAMYLNDVLSALNTLARCSVFQCVSSVVEKLNDSLRRVGAELSKWGDGEWLTWDIREQNEFNRMKRYFEHLLVPHLDKVFQVIFPPGSISTLTGYGITQCANMIQIKYTSANNDVTSESS